MVNQPCSSDLAQLSGYRVLVFAFLPQLVLPASVGLKA